MKPANPPDKEDERLESLKQLDILDTPPEERFDRITRLARKSLNAPVALISLVDEDRQWFKSAQGLSSLETSRAVSFCGHAIHSDEVFLVFNALEDERFADNPLVTAEAGIRLYAGRPIKAPDGQRIGTLCVIDSEPRELGHDDLTALEDLAVLVETELRAEALGLSERELRRQLTEAERRAAIDGLTRLWNREITTKILAEEIERSVREELTLTVLLIDLDHFKRVNDEHGHLAGDRVLTEVAARMRGAIRTYDTLGRYGGEEFFTVLPCCDAACARVIGERIRRVVSARPILLDAGEVQVSATVGACAVHPSAGMTVEDLIARADQALYAGKRAGRDRVVLAGDQESTS